LLLYGAGSLLTLYQLTLTFLFSLFQSARKLVQHASLVRGLQELFQFDFIMFLISIFLLTTASGRVNSFSACI
jgi:hypothetical protein